MEKIIVGENESAQRLDKLLHKYLQLAGNGFLYKMLRKKNIVLNGKKADGTEILKTGDEVKLFLSDETIKNFQKAYSIQESNSKLDILFENKDVLIVNKPSGMLSQKAKTEDVSLVDEAISYLVSKGETNSVSLLSFRPGICNRLDRNTSGPVVVGKTLSSLQLFNRLIAGKEVRKFYITVVEGIITEKKHEKAYLKKLDNNTVKVFNKKTEDSKLIDTSYEPIGRIGNRTILKVEIHTGRSHQIRAQLAFDGHPVVGDPKYNKAKTSGIPYQLLHSYCLVFPDNKELNELSGKKVYSPLPKVFNSFLEGIDINYREILMKRGIY